MSTPPPAPPPTFLSFSAEVNPTTTESLLAAMNNLIAQGAQEIHLLLSTPGGSVMNGINIYNVLRALPIKLVTHNVGNVDSIGNTIFLAGETRYACPHSTFMFHGVGFDITQVMRFDERALAEKLVSVQADQKRIAAVIEERTSLTAEEIAAMFLEAATKDATYAVGKGIVHEIRDVNVPMGAAVHQLVFQR
ncbi:MAG: ATP-dependent Clp protease proteolytic subunit [Actinomycetes bacterium]